VDAQTILADFSHTVKSKMDLHSASNVLPLPVSRCWSLQANPTARHQQTLRDHVIQVGVSRDMPVYSPGCRQVLTPA